MSEKLPATGYPLMMILKEDSDHFYIEPPENGYSSMLEPEEGETWAEYWQRVNEYDGDTLRLYCQSCCDRYPYECLVTGLIHPYDRIAEVCPDFVPKGLHKGRNEGKCWRKRVVVDPSWEPHLTWFTDLREAWKYGNWDRFIGHWRG